MKYRPHKGGFDESMKLVVEVNSEKELKAIIEKNYELLVHEIEIEPYCYDPRNMWDTHIVLVKFAAMKEFVPMGYTDGNLDK